MVINNIMYADNAVILTKTTEDLQGMINYLVPTL